MQEPCGLKSQFQLIPGIDEVNASDGSDSRPWNALRESSEEWVKNNFQEQVKDSVFDIYL